MEKLEVGQVWSGNVLDFFNEPETESRKILDYGKGFYGRILVSYFILSRSDFECDECEEYEFLEWITRTGAKLEGRDGE